MEKYTVCKSRFVEINDDIYGSPQEAWDFNNFVSKLFEIDDDNVDIIKHNNFECRSKSAFGGNPNLKIKDLSNLQNEENENLPIRMNPMMMINIIIIQRVTRFEQIICIKKMI